MNTKKIAEAFNTLSLAFGELAEALNESGAASSAPSTAPEPLEELEDDGLSSTVAAIEQAEQKALIPEGSLLICPKHHKPYREGKFGPFCSQKSDDPAWSKNGFCSINPKNVAVWLRVQAAA